MFRTVKELRKRLQQRQIDSTGCLEKSDLLHLLHTVRLMQLILPVPSRTHTL